MERKIIQIASTVMPEHGTVLAALCDDGTVWELDRVTEWTPCPPIPQPEKE